MLIETTYQPFISLFHQTEIVKKHPELAAIRALFCHLFPTFSSLSNDTRFPLFLPYSFLTPRSSPTVPLLLVLVLFH